MDGVTGGRLADVSSAPPVGERTQVLVAAHGFTVEQILSGRLDAPVADDQDHDEWVVVLEGGAVLEIDGVERTMARGDWLLLPARVPHRLISTQIGTSWLAVRSQPGADGHVDGAGASSDQRSNQ